MKIAQESVSVLPNAARGEVDVVLAGLRITLTTDEALLLAAGLATSLELLQGAAQREVPAAEPWGIGRSTPAEPPSGAAGKDAVSESDAVLRTRALIQASMRSKGLSLREAPRE